MENTIAIRSILGLYLQLASDYCFTNKRKINPRKIDKAVLVFLEEKDIMLIIFQIEPAYCI